MRLPAGVRDALQRAADADQRSLSAMAVKIITAFLAAEGYLAAPGAPAKKRARSAHPSRRTGSR